MAQKSNYSFPDLNLTDKQKDNKKYHEDFTRAICHSSINSTYGLYRKSIDTLYDYMHGAQGDEEWRFLQESPTGEALPAKWVPVNRIAPKIELLCGELAQKGYDIKVSAINKEAKVRKLDVKNRLITQMNLAPVAGMLEQNIGLPLKSEGFVPETQEELNEYMDYNYKEKSEIIMESALKFVTRKYDWEYKRIAIFRDICIAGSGFLKSEVVNGMPKFRRIDPRFMIWDQNAKDDFLSDAAYFGEISYLTFAEVAERYNISREDLKDAAGSYEEYMKITSRGQDAGELGFFSCIDNNVMKFFKSEDGDLRVLVVNAVWRDYKDYDHKVTKDKYGTERVQRVTRGKNSEEYIRRRLQTWRQGTLVGGKYLVEWGEMKNQARMNSCLHEALPPYLALIPNYFNGRTMSKVQQLKSLQDLKNIVMYNLLLTMSRAGAKGFFYDLAQIPEGWKPEDVVQYLKTVGIAWIDSQKDGQVSSFNQFKEFDLTLSDSTSKYIEISMLIDREMDAISGINEARQGLVQKASQAVGVTQSSLFQSSLSTATLFKFFNIFTNKFLQHQAELIKNTWANKEEYAYIIGDTGIDFLKEDIDLALDDYGVFVEETSPLIGDLQQFQQLVQAALQAGQIDFLSTLKLLQERDVKQGILKFENEIKKSQRRQQEAQAQEHEQAMQLIQEQNKGAMEAEQMKQEGDMTKLQSELSNEENIELIKGRFNLMGKKIDLRKRLYENFRPV
jgi:hypothetical protein